jgi:hypothetical protein
MEPMAAVAGGLVVPGRTLWIVLWYAILALGSLGLLGALFWGPDLRWRNLDEILRGLGTVVASAGMLTVLHGGGVTMGEALLAFALLIFVAAYAVGDPMRRRGGKPLQIVLEEDRPPPPPFRVIHGRRYAGPRRV